MKPYQRVFVVHLDEDARRLLLDVQQISAQQQAAHRQTLIPCGTESLTDHLKATHTHTHTHTHTMNTYHNTKTTSTSSDINRSKLTLVVWLCDRKVTRANGSDRPEVSAAMRPRA